MQVTALHYRIITLICAGQVPELRPREGLAARREMARRAPAISRPIRPRMVITPLRCRR